MAHTENEDFDIFALKIIDIGLRVYQSSKKSSKDSIDPITLTIFQNTLETNFLIKEIIGHVFTKENSTFKAYDSSAAIQLSENMAHAFIKGKAGI